ncbi:uncharacterized protein CLUP02_06476 [Colletotrichum lupini]|uniref:Uncharacterized protein n=1 Tax=Colletotrichum lupini TaxID=145971 RepID=A0A9Q8WFR6_9PEZI|nr:uncharacterized protein CLUP02_06476 [Colletotrichum lupini]UQC80990.1 hypothetical protein CLUP02_06476 [Colletotrichum lupini]
MVTGRESGPEWIVDMSRDIAGGAVFQIARPVREQNSTSDPTWTDRVVGIYCEKRQVVDGPVRLSSVKPVFALKRLIPLHSAIAPLRLNKAVWSIHHISHDKPLTHGLRKCTWKIGITESAPWSSPNDLAEPVLEKRPLTNVGLIAEDMTRDSS